MRLRRFEKHWADALGRTIAPRGLFGGVVDDVDLGARYDDECAASPWFAAVVLRFSLWMAWLAPLWMLRRPRTFGGLAPSEREQVLERLLLSESYTVRLTAMFLKLTVLTLLIGDERALTQIGAYGLSGERPATLRKRAAEGGP